MDMSWTAAGAAAAVVVVRGRPVESCGESAVQAVPEFLDLAGGQHVHHAMRMQLGGEYRSCCNRFHDLQRGVCLHAFSVCHTRGHQRLS